MNGMLVGGGLLMAIGGALLYFRKGKLESVAEMKYLQTSALGDVIDNWRNIGPQVGPGRYSEYVELKGKGTVERPLKGPHSGRECLYFRASVVREYEETVHVKDDKGNDRTEVKRGSETVSTQESSDAFYLEESGARVAVRPASSEKYTVKSCDRFEPGEYRGSWRIDFGMLGGGRKTIGYRYVEEILPVGAPLYVVGEVSDREGELAVGAPTERGRKFLISAKSEEELQQEMSSQAKMMLYAGIGSLVIGVGLVVASFVS